VKIGKGIGARYAVAGSIAAIDPSIRIDIRLIEVATGKVVMADKVVGTKNEFFELESLLATKFLAALDTKLATGTKAKTSGAKTLDTVMAYSQGVDSADKGDLEAASKHLSKVVTAAPEFKLAQDKYIDIVRRLHEARAKRKEILQTGEQILVQNALTYLKGHNLATLAEPEAGTYMAYRVLLGQYYLFTLGKVLGLTPDKMQSMEMQRVSSALRVEALRWIRAYYENTLLLIDEQKRLEDSSDRRLRGFSGNDYELPDDDEKRGEEMGIKNPGEWTFAHTWSMIQELSEFIFSGKPGFWTGFSFQVTPSPAELDETFIEPMLKLLDEAVVRLDKRDMDKDMKDRDTIRVLDAHAKGLMRIRRKTEAIARWQIILDRYPTCEEYPEIEKNIQAALGIDETGEADGTLAKLLDACDAMQLITYLSQTVFMRMMKVGPDEMIHVVREAHKNCQKSKSFQQMGLGFFNTAAVLFLNQGHCAEAVESEKLMLQYPYAENISGQLRSQIREKCKE
jgi:tetratricopeptide (TPR) repeat protein